MKKIALLLTLLLPVTALAEESATGFENYQNWTFVGGGTMPQQLNGLTLPMYTDEIVRRVFVENLADPNSRAVAEVYVLGKLVLKALSVDRVTSESVQMLVKGEWKNGKPGAYPRFYVVWKRSFPLFGKWDAVGLRVTLEPAEGKKPLKIIVRAEPKKEVSK